MADDLRHLLDEALEEIDRLRTALLAIPKDDEVEEALIWAARRNGVAS